MIKTVAERDTIKDLRLQIEDENTKLSKAIDLLLKGQIEAYEFRTIRSQTEAKINRLEALQTGHLTDKFSIKPLLNKAESSLKNLAVLYENGSVIRKRRVVGSIFPEKLVFDGTNYRTERLNEAVMLMTLINSELEEKKEKTNPFF